MVYFRADLIETDTKREAPVCGSLARSRRRLLDRASWLAARDQPKGVRQMGCRLSPILAPDARKTWDVLLEVLSGNDSVPDAVRMIDPRIARARRHAAGRKGDSEKRSWAFARRVLYQYPTPHDCGRPSHRNRSSTEKPMISRDTAR